MKKYFIIASVAVAGLFASCSDNLLENDRSGLVTAETAIQTSDDLRLLLNTAYGTLKSADEISFSSVFTDEAAIGASNGGQGKGADNGEAIWQILPITDNANSIWTKYYFCMAYINRVIKFSDNVTPVDAADQETINRILAEAYTLRAFCHNQLLSYYSTDPKDMSALGVILDVDVYTTDYLGSRVPNSEIYAQIDEDLDTASALYAGLPPTPTGATFFMDEVFYANRYFVTALKARSAALRGNYPTALAAAQDVISNSGILLAPATGSTNYMTYFHSDAGAFESIFKLKNNGSNAVQIGNVWAGVNATVNGNAWFEMGRSLFNALNTTSYASAMNITVTGNAGNSLVIPGNTLQVNDMISFPESRPVGAVTTNGSTTSPSNALVAGKVYFVKTISGDNVTLTDTFNGTATINLSGMNPGGNPFVPLTGKVNAGDVRYGTNVHPTSIINPDYLTASDYATSDKITIRKYQGGPATGGNLRADFKICRISEMYLIKAEGQIAAGDLAGAAVTIKQIRDARFNKPQPLPAYANATEAWKDVLFERQKELAEEGFRFIDLKRLGQLAGMSQFERDPQDCSLVNGACSLPFSDYRWALPIPSVETQPNPGIEQNPGY